MVIDDRADDTRGFRRPRERAGCPRVAAPSTAKCRGVALGNKYVGGQDTGDRALTVLVESKMPDELLSEDDRVPGELDGVTTDVQEVGVIQAGGGPVLDTIDPAAAATQEVGPFTLRQRARPGVRRPQHRALPDYGGNPQHVLLRSQSLPVSPESLLRAQQQSRSGQFQQR